MLLLINMTLKKINILEYAFGEGGGGHQKEYAVYAFINVDNCERLLNMDLNPSHTRVSGHGTVYRMNYDGVTTLGNFVDCSDAGTVPCVDARLVDSR